MTLKPVYVAIGASFTKVRPATVLPRIDGGTDFGTARKLLARVSASSSSASGRNLIWTPGAKHWKSIMAGYVYRPGNLTVQWHGDSHGKDWLYSEEYGATRLDLLLRLSAVQAWIKTRFCRDEKWADELLSHLDARSTVTIRPGSPPKPRRKHSRSGRVRCDLCSPLRCTQAPEVER